MASEMAFVMHNPPMPQGQQAEIQTGADMSKEVTLGGEGTKATTVAAKEATPADGEPLHRCPCTFCIEATTVPVFLSGQASRPRPEPRRKSSFERMIKGMHLPHLPKHVDTPDQSDVLEAGVSPKGLDVGGTRSKTQASHHSLHLPHWPHKQQTQDGHAEEAAVGTGHGS